MTCQLSFSVDGNFQYNVYIPTKKTACTLESALFSRVQSKISITIHDEFPKNLQRLEDILVGIDRQYPYCQKVIFIPFEYEKSIIQDASREWLDKWVAFFEMLYRCKVDDLFCCGTAVKPRTVTEVISVDKIRALAKGSDFNCWEPYVWDRELARKPYYGFQSSRILRSFKLNFPAQVGKVYWQADLFSMSRSEMNIPKSKTNENDVIWIQWELQFVYFWYRLNTLRFSFKDQA